MSGEIRADSTFGVRERGAISILTAITLVLLVSLLALVVDSGRLYFEQRNLQKIADMAALETVSRLPNGHCANASRYQLDIQSLARENAQSHNFLDNTDSEATQQLIARCGDIFTVDGIREKQAREDGPAVLIEARHEVPASLIMRAGSLFNAALPANIDLRASAAATKSEPVTAFSVGSQLLRLNDNALLAAVLRDAGLDTHHLSVLDSRGLVEASISPAGLLDALGIELNVHQLRALSPADLVALVETRVGPLPISDLVALIGSVVPDTELRATLMALAGDIHGNPLLSLQSVPLLGLGNTPGLIRLEADTGNPLGALLDTQINLGALLGATLLFGAQGRALHIPELNLLGVQVQLGVVEPPAIGIGPVGTKAYSAQIRLHLDVDTNRLLGGSLSWLTNTILGTRIRLPIWIDLVAGSSTVTDIDCGSQTPTVDIQVDAHILDLCIGEASDDFKWTAGSSCAAMPSETELIRLLHLPVLTSPAGGARIPALHHQDDMERLVARETRSSSVNPLDLGQAVDALVSGLLDVLSGIFRSPSSELASQLTPSPTAQDQLIANMAHQYLEATKSNGFYNVDQVIDLVLHGSDQTDEQGNQVLSPLVDDDWAIPNSIPRSCLLTVCPVSMWNDGTFSSAMKAYTVPGGLLDLLGISTLGNGYLACGGLLSSLLNWNNCIRHNLTRILQQKPGGINLSQSQDGLSIANPSTPVTCSGFICTLLQPVLTLIKPILTGIGDFLMVILNDTLGIELGRVDVSVESIQCGAPTLVH